VSVFVVDPDIDIFPASRWNGRWRRDSGDRDLVVQSGMRSMPLDPSVALGRSWARPDST
jgi:hypothetical protein